MDFLSVARPSRIEPLAPEATLELIYRRFAEWLLSKHGYMIDRRLCIEVEHWLGAILCEIDLGEQFEYRVTFDPREILIKMAIGSAPRKYMDISLNSYEISSSFTGPPPPSLRP